MPGRPWIMRTYSGHSSARATNELFRANLAKGQTGLSVAFDLPTQTGYDPDAEEARGEVGKVGVPVAHIGHMAELMDQIPMGSANTSMTINATAPWMLGLYVANAAHQGVPASSLAGTTQNDLVKEYLSRGTYIFPPEASLRLTVDVIAYTVSEVPRWNPVNVCSYHLQEAGATPAQEVAYAIATAIAIVEAVAASGKVAPAMLGEVVGRVSFFLNSGIRFIEETCKVRAMAQMWDETCRERFAPLVGGPLEERQVRFRYGVQVNSLGLTEAQPENNVQRIVLEMLGVTLPAATRARALQLPCWNEALGLPRAMDQQWSLRMQQVLAYETDLLEHGDIFEGSKVIEAKTAEIAGEARDELGEVLALGGAFEAIDELKSRLVASHTERMRRIESGEQKVVGVNCFTETGPSPLTGGVAEAHLRADPAVEEELRRDLAAWRAARDAGPVRRALGELAAAAASGASIMPATIALAHAGGTTGEWAHALRRVLGEYRAPTGARGGAGRRRGDLAELASRVASMEGGPPRLLIAKPGLDGHSNGAEQVAVAARDAGFEVIYPGIRLRAPEIAAMARDEDVEVVGLSVLSASHIELSRAVMEALADQSLSPLVILGGIVPAADRPVLAEIGVAAVFTPSDYKLAEILDRVAQMVSERRAGGGPPAANSHLSREPSQPM
ncbi:MAG: methylmalonyl-CoA mutase family protein [Acidimicrobiales bacterium]